MSIAFNRVPSIMKPWITSADVARKRDLAHAGRVEGRRLANLPGVYAAGMAGEMNAHADRSVSQGGEEDHQQPRTE